MGSPFELGYVKDKDISFSFSLNTKSKTVLSLKSSAQIIIFLSVCQNVEAGNEEGSAAIRMIAITYVYLINKYMEFADTFFFVARKKDNQVIVTTIAHRPHKHFYFLHIVRSGVI